MSIQTPVPIGTAPIQQAAAPPSLPGVNVTLIGASGTGKTWSLGTIVDAGFDLFYLGLEPGLESLIGYFTDPVTKGGKGLKEAPPNLHWHTVQAPAANFADLIQNAQNINTMSLEFLAKAVDPQKSKHNQFVALLNALNNFPDDRTGQKFGAVNTWGTNRVLAIDGLTGLGNAAMSLVVGGKAVRSQSDWGIAQHQVETIITMLCNNCPCHFILLGHVEREADLLTGGAKIMASSLGKALAPKLPRLFSDVIMATREGKKWSWDTANPLADLKTRNLDIASGLPASFGPVFASWNARKALLEASQ